MITGMLRTLCEGVMATTLMGIAFGWSCPEVAWEVAAGEPT